MNSLELAILKWFSERHGDCGLINLDSKLEVSNRDITEIGFFTHFKETKLDISEGKFGCLSGPFIHSEQVPNGAMSLLSMNGCVVKYLEVVAMDDADDANKIEEFELGEEF